MCDTTLERLSSLLDQNLIRRAPSAAGSRYSLLETIREVAAELLEISHDVETTRRRHAEHASLLLALANLEYERGANSGFGGDELNKAERLTVEALGLNLRVRSRPNEAVGLWLMARIVRSRGNLGAAHPLLEQSLAAARATRSLYWEAYIAETRLVGQWALNRPGWESDVVARGQPDFERAREEGRALSLDEATAYALQPNGAGDDVGRPNTGSVA